jgi:hypothetical protein
MAFHFANRASLFGIVRFKHLSGLVWRPVQFVISNAASTRSGGGGPNKCNLAVGSGAPAFFDFPLDNRARGLPEHNAAEPHATAGMGASADFDNVGVGGEKPYLVDKTARALRA